MTATPIGNPDRFAVSGRVPVEQLLSLVEGRVATAGVAPGEVDAAVAAELGVPADAYAGFWAVRAAAVAYGEQTRVDAGLPLQTARRSGTAWERARACADAAGWAAQRICDEADGAGHADVRAAAVRIVGAAAQLRAELDDLAPTRGEPDHARTPRATWGVGRDG